MTTVNANFDVSGQPLAARAPQGGFRKRVFDITAASLLLLLFLPLMFFIGVIMFSTEGGDIFFAHSRIGYRGRQGVVFRGPAADETVWHTVAGQTALALEHRRGGEARRLADAGEGRAAVLL